MPPLRSLAGHSLASGASAGHRVASVILGKSAAAASPRPLRDRLRAKASIKVLLLKLTWRQACLLWRLLFCSG
jgi:hypothetical protein